MPLFLILLLCFLAPADAATGRNFARPEHGAFVLASSFADYTTHYPDRLLDGNPDSFWRASASVHPQWLEIRWPIPLRINALEFVESAPLPYETITFQAWRGHQWEEIKPVASSQDASLRFPEICTDRLRITLPPKGEGDTPWEINALKVTGPDQPLPGDLAPRWKASYIWHPEPTRTYKGNIPYYFRKTFLIEDPSAVLSASIQARSNDHYSIFINGKAVHRTSSARAAHATSVRSHLRKGENTIAIETNLNSTPTWGLGLLIAELHLVEASKTRQIGTDASWKTSNRHTTGWEKTDFDDREWEQAHPFFPPPEGPWGDIRYILRLPQEHTRIKTLSVTPENPAPGEKVTVTLKLHNTAPLKGHYVYLLELGLPGRLVGKSDYRIATVFAHPKAAEDETASTTLEAELILPPHTPGGPLPLTLKGYDQRHGHQLSIIPPESSALHLNVKRPASAPFETSPTHARIKSDSPALSLNGRPYAPLFWSPLVPTFEKFQEYSRTGIDLFFLSTNQKVGPPDWASQTLPAIDESVENLLKINPDARILLKVELRPTFDWLDANPAERLIKANGRPGPQSFASERYLALVEKHLVELITHIQSRPYASRIVGYMLWAPGRADAGLGGAEENIWQSKRDKIVIGDYNPQAIAAFREWLRTRYDDSIPRLRKAWKQPTVSFETAMPDRRSLIAEGVNGGVFTDPQRGRASYDYFEFLSGVLPEFYLRLGRLIKEKTGGQALVGIHYGYIIDQVRAMHPGTGVQNGNFHLSQMLESDVIDFYCGSTVYGEARKNGQAFQVRLPWGSINLHGRLYLNDGDLRTYLAYPITYGRQTSEQESLNILRRDLGSTLTRRLGIWFADFSKEEGRSAVPWFLSPPLLETIGKVGDLYRQRVENPPESTTKIAVFLDEKSYFTHDFYASPLLYENLSSRLVYHELPRLGAPFDVFTLADLKDPRVRGRYRLFIFLNAFHLSLEDRQNIASIQTAKNTLLWFYAPGYFGETLSPAGISHITGITTRQIAETPPRYTLAQHHSITSGIIERSTRLLPINGKKQRETLGEHATRLRPGFLVDDTEAEPLAHWPDGGVAVAKRSFGEWTSIYSALPFMSASLLRGIAREAGVHLYAHEDILLDADSRLITLHYSAPEPRRLTLDLPAEANVTNALSGEVIGEKVKRIEVDIHGEQTLLYQLESL